MLENNQGIIVYNGLLSQVKETSESNGKPFFCDETGFQKALGSAPKKVFFDEFCELEGDAFLTCVFLSCFQRLPSEKELLEYKDLSKEEILKKAVNKASYSVRRMELKNCPYKVKPGLRGKLFKTAALIASSATLRKLAKKMPRGIQNKIRAIFC